MEIQQAPFDVVILRLAAIKEDNGGHLTPVYCCRLVYTSYALDGVGVQKVSFDVVKSRLRRIREYNVDNFFCGTGTTLVWYLRVSIVHQNSAQSSLLVSLLIDDAFVRNGDEQ
jgi:hypothetical protein